MQKAGAAENFENDLWAIALAKMQESEPPLPDEKTVIFLGEKKSGKSSLATLISSEREKEELKPTAALDFKFERNTPAPNKKEVSNLFELGGGRLLANLVAGTAHNAQSFERLQEENRGFRESVQLLWV